MLVQYGAGVLDARGSIGGQTFSRNTYGAYARARTTPVNPRSARQVVVRSNISSLAEYWGGTLTGSQRAAWAVYADAITMTNRLGQSIKLAGFNHFIRGNAARLMCGAAIVDDGPTVLGVPATDPTYAVAVSEATQQISVTFDNTLDWANEDDGYMTIAMSSPRGAGVSFIGAPLRFAGKIDGATPTPPTSPATIAVPFPVAAGQVVCCVARILRGDGRASTPFRKNAAVAA